MRKHFLKLLTKHSPSLSSFFHLLKVHSYSLFFPFFKVHSSHQHLTSLLKVQLFFIDTQWLCSSFSLPVNLKIISENSMNPLHCECVVDSSVLWSFGSRFSSFSTLNRRENGYLHRGKWKNSQSFDQVLDFAC